MPTDGEDTWVYLIEQNKYDFSSLVQKISDVFQKKQIFFQEKSVLLKISLVFPVKNPERVKMIITNPVLTMAVAEVICSRGAKVVYIGDGETMGSARYSFKMTQMDKHLKLISSKFRKKIKFAYLDELPRPWITPEKPFTPEIALDYPRLVREVNYFISLPKLKVNIFANITLSIKNGMGLISKPTRLKYHGSQLHSLIADIYQIRPPDLVITDAIFAGEGQGPMEASAYPTGLVIMGNNGLAVDTVCCNLMGYSPKEILHLKLLEEGGYGFLNLANISELDHEILKKHQHEFKRPDMSLSNLAPNIHVYEGKTCKSGCKAFIRAILDGYGRNAGWNSLGEVYIILGENLKIPPEELEKLPKKRTIILGKCAEEFKNEGAYFGGCAPDYIQMLEKIPVKTEIPITPWIKYVSLRTLLWTSLQHAVFRISRFWKKFN
ncbi:MAG: DUF362 domain-containing protein [Promethearchaeota archaeon]